MAQKIELIIWLFSGSILNIQNWNVITTAKLCSKRFQLTELLDEFEQNLEDYDPFADDVVEHHEESVAFQRSFYQKAINLRFTRGEIHLR